MSHPRAMHLIEMAEMCDAFNCTPEIIRRSYDPEYPMIAKIVQMLRQKYNPINNIKL